MQKNKHVLESKIVHVNPWFRIHQEKIKYPNQKIGQYYILKRDNQFVAIIARIDDKILLLNQWRASLLKWYWELPMGGVDANENALKAAKREFFEETGYKAKKWQKIGEFYVGPGHTDQKGLVYFASDLVKITGKAEDKETEIIKVHLIEIKKLEEMIKKGILKDGPSLAAWTLYKSLKP